MVCSCHAGAFSHLTKTVLGEVGLSKVPGEELGGDPLGTASAGADDLASVSALPTLSHPVQELRLCHPCTVGVVVHVVEV